MVLEKVYQARTGIEGCEVNGNGKIQAIRFGKEQIVVWMMEPLAPAVPLIITADMPSSLIRGNSLAAPAGSCRKQRPHLREETIRRFLTRLR